MNANESGENVAAAGFECFYDELRLVREHGKAVNSVHTTRDNGIFKNYLEFEAVIIVEIHIPNVAGNYCLIFFRVPPRVEYPKCLDKTLHLEPGQISAGNLSVDTKADSVFAVRQHG